MGGKARPTRGEPHRDRSCVDRNGPPDALDAHPTDPHLVERIVSRDEVGHGPDRRQQDPPAVGAAPHHVGEGPERSVVPAPGDEPIARRERRAQDVSVEDEPVGAHRASVRSTGAPAALLGQVHGSATVLRIMGRGT